MKKGDDWLDSSSNHTRDEVIVVCHALFVHWAIAEWEESRPIKSRHEPGIPFITTS